MKNSFIWIYDNSLSPEFCKSVIEKFESDERRVQGVAGYRVRNEVKKSTDLSLSCFPDWKEYDEVFCQALNQAIPKYLDYIDTFLQDCPKFFPEEYTTKLSEMIPENLFDTGYQIQKTQPNDFYDWHHDSMLEFNSIKTEGKAYLRYITFIWYLNDVIHDGYTQFLNGEKVQPREGRLVLFPATWNMYHRGYPPKYETKYICTGWLYHALEKDNDVWSMNNSVE